MSSKTLLLQEMALLSKGKLQGPTDKQWVPVNFLHTFGQSCTGFLLLNTTCISVCTLCWPQKRTHKSNWDADNYPYNWGRCIIYFQMPIICFLRKSNFQISQLYKNSAADQHWRCWSTCSFLMFTRESSCTYMHSSFEFLHPKPSIEIFYRFQL
jgi:hypothetical protein